ncbi:MAG: hypothetical protein HY934_07025 [Candidatus Firestonebacteria bacterium]|nr:hypothetical protein [Candidatus Firestonebacteria bacterium]
MNLVKNIKLKSIKKLYNVADFQRYQRKERIMAICPNCHGDSNCSACYGTGHLPVFSLSGGEKSKCLKCGESGKCQTCGGSGCVNLVKFIILIIVEMMRFFYELTSVEVRSYLAKHTKVPSDPNLQEYIKKELKKISKSKNPIDANPLLTTLMHYDPISAANIYVSVIPSGSINIDLFKDFNISYSHGKFIAWTNSYNLGKLWFDEFSILSLLATGLNSGTRIIPDLKDRIYYLKLEKQAEQIIKQNIYW